MNTITWYLCYFVVHCTSGDVFIYNVRFVNPDNNGRWRAKNCQTRSILFRVYRGRHLASIKGLNFFFFFFFFFVFFMSTFFSSYFSILSFPRRSIWFVTRRRLDSSKANARVRVGVDRLADRLSPAGTLGSTFKNPLLQSVYLSFFPIFSCPCLAPRSLLLALSITNVNISHCLPLPFLSLVFFFVFRETTRHPRSIPPPAVQRQSCCLTDSG